MAIRRKTSVAGIRLGESTVNGKGETTLDVTAFRRIVEILESSDIRELIWRRGDERLVVKREPRETSDGKIRTSIRSEAPGRTDNSTPKSDVGATPAPEKSGHLVTSPFVGTFYRASSPDQPTFVELGATVRKGQVLCIIEAMKLMNEIESDVDGKVVEILAQNAQPVEFGQGLFRLEPVGS